MTIKIVNPFFEKVMNKVGFDGWTSFWGDIYVKPGYENDTSLIKHEQEHLEQIKKEGKLKFAIKYSYYYLRYGYCNNPYEIAAREATTKV
jgi:hypothetical protein